MPLQQLVNHFNDRFEQEHHSSFRPFVLEKKQVFGVFGPIKVSSQFSLVRSAKNPEQLTGHIANLTVAPDDNFQTLQRAALQPPTDFQSIINLDRLSRTVHMLNYLPYSHLDKVLFLDVEPRHILGVAANHGAYFEEVIRKCGLATKQIVISMVVNSYYALNHNDLLAGLQNYRQRGYLIALNIGSLYTSNGLVDLVSKLSPDYLRVNVPGSGQGELDLQITWPFALSALTDLMNLVGGQTVLQQVDEQEQAFIVANMNFNLVQGRYYDHLLVDHLRCL